MYNRLISYNWQQKDWAQFNYQSSEIQELLLESIEKISLLTGGIRGLEEETKLDTVMKIMLTEALKSSEIEGDILDKQEVFSSVRNHLGIKRI